MKMTTKTGRYRTADGKAEIEWRLEPKENGLEFSASGEFNGGAGQCIDSIAEAYPADAIVQRIATVWREYHFNGMQSGTPEQVREVERRRALAEDYARKQTDAGHHFFDPELKEPNWHSLCRVFGHDSFYSWECAVLREANLYEVPLPEGLKATGGFPPEVVNGSRGYRFGERWIFLPLPAEVIVEIQSWSNAPMPAESLNEFKAKQFLSEHGLKLRITLADAKPAPWDVAGHHYRVTINREQKRGARITFDFWGSQADMEAGKEPTAPGVFSCIDSDANCPETFAEFCAEYGDNEDSIKARQTFNRANKFARRLREFFTAEEIEALAEIR